jgi:hypothetical protein
MIVVRRSGHARRMVTEATSNEIIPSLRDGLFFGVIPGSKLPGLRSSSPSGTKTLRALLADTVPRLRDDLCLCPPSTKSNWAIAPLRRDPDGFTAGGAHWPP